MRMGRIIPSKRSVSGWGIESDFRVSGRWRNDTSFERFDGEKKEREMFGSEPGAVK